MTEVASYKPKDGSTNLTIGDFKITKVDLGVLNLETKEHKLVQSSQYMLVQSQKDGNEKRGLKKTINMMIKYIDSLGGCSVVPPIQAP